MADCVALAGRVGAEVASRFGIPVYLYEEAASRPERTRLEHIRRGGFEALADRMKDPAWRPDFGPAAPHPSAGASVIGARPPLIAYNVTLKTRDVAIARAIAAAVRESSGGLPFVKAMAVDLADRGVVQVSMNLTNYRQTPISASLRGSGGGGNARRGNRSAARSSASSPPTRLPPAAGADLKLGASFGEDRILEHHALRQPSSTAPGYLLVFAASPRDAEAPHLPVEVAALDAQRFGRARDVAVVGGERAQDVVALARVARLVAAAARSRAAPRGRRRRRRAGRRRETHRSAAAIVSPGTMITSRSITLRSSRTLPGQGSCAAPSRRLGVERFGAAAVLARELRHEVLGEQRDVLLPRRAAAARRSGSRSAGSRGPRGSGRRGSRPPGPCWWRR